MMRVVNFRVRVRACERTFASGISHSYAYASPFSRCSSRRAREGEGVALRWVPYQPCRPIPDRIWGRGLLMMAWIKEAHDSLAVSVLYMASAELSPRAPTR